jgi:histidinol phosphatase-like enzyme (inositol monophosphatase family)
MPSLIENLEMLARQAGEITLSYFQKPIEIETKENLSPVTIADKETESFLRREIERLYPGDSILGEEFGETAGNGRKWFVDPIDGTKTFVHGVPLYGVMIGVEEEGEIIAGVVNIPAMNDFVIAQKGSGTKWNGKPARVSTVSEFSAALLLTTDFRNNEKYGHGKAWQNLTAQARLVRTWGDCYGHLLVATGRADVMVDPQLNPWDAAALKVIVEEAGGRFTDYQGNATIYGDSGISSNGILQDKVLQIAGEM